MQDAFEATFTISVAPDVAWRSLTDRYDREAERIVLPGFETSGKVLEADAPTLLRVFKDSEPCADTEVLVTLEATGSGARVTVVQSGFAAKKGFGVALESLEVGWSHIVADLVVALERGVRPERHFRPWAMLGCSVASDDGGLVVRHVWGGAAEEMGLEPGDLILTVGGAPIVIHRELETVMRVLRSGEQVDVTWLRGAETLTATGTL